jgi:hypothetical protein
VPFFQHYRQRPIFGLPPISWRPHVPYAFGSAARNTAPDLEHGLCDLLDTANETIVAAAEAIEEAQAAVGGSYYELKSAVESMDVPEEIPVP